MTEPDVKDDLQSALPLPSFAAQARAAAEAITGVRQEIGTVDRRRPGRLNVSPTLVPLLRGDIPDPRNGIAALPRPDQDLVWDKDDALAPARGIALGLLISIPLWVAIYAVGRALLRVALGV